MEIEKLRPRIPDSTRWRIIGYLEAGKSQHEASLYFGVTQGGISKIWKKYQLLGDVKSKKRWGRPTKVNEEEKEKIIQELQEKFASSKQVAILHNLCKAIILNIAHEKNLNFRYYEEKIFICNAY